MSTVNECGLFWPAPESERFRCFQLEAFAWSLALCHSVIVCLKTPAEGGREVSSVTQCLNTPTSITPIL